LERIGASGQDVATTIITLEEQLRGWLAEIHRLTDPHGQIVAYERLQRRIETNPSSSFGELNRQF
jgi:hypothetical protein